MRACLVAIAVASCSSPSAAPAGRIRVAVTIDWEGAEIAADQLAVVADVRKALGDIPLTHFVSAAYLAKGVPPTAIARAIRPGDELAMHLHVWRSLAKASGIEPRLAPSFLTGTDEIAPFEDDQGFDTDPDTYDVAALRALLVTSRRLLAQTGLPVAKTFRAGGYLATPKMLLAIASEGYTVDSSAVDFHQLEGADEGAEALPKRVREVWPHVDATSQPFRLPTGGILEMPIAAVTDYVTTDQIVRIFESAHARLAQDPARDVFVVLAFHLENADDFASRLRDALLAVRKKHGDELSYVTIDHAAELARFAL